MEETIEVFLSYDPRDKALRDELLKQLAPLEREKLISIWHDGEISAGTDWQRAIDRHLNAAPLILLLISPDFFASEDRYSREMQRAVERHDASEARVIPIILRPTDWHNTPFSKLQPLPPGDKPVTSWSDRDAALLAVAQGIRKAVEELRFQAKELESLAARLPEVPESAVVIAKRVITFLEDRRVLYDPYNVQVAEFCVASVDKMRQFLTEQLFTSSLPDDLKNNMRAMRSACRKFMQKVVIPPTGSRPEYGFYDPQYTPVLTEALGELRATFGRHVEILVAQYHITDIDEGLASTLPTHHENESE